MNGIRLFLGLALCVLYVCGCASIKHKNVTTFDKPKGIPYYEGSYYLLVYSDSKGGLNTEVLYLPDPTKKRIAIATNNFASLKSTLKFTNGMLTSSLEEPDTTAVPKAIIQAVEKVVDTLAGETVSTTNDDGSFDVPAPCMYKIAIRDDTVTFTSNEATKPSVIKVTLSKSIERK